MKRTILIILILSLIGVMNYFDLHKYVVLPFVWDWTLYFGLVVLIITYNLVRGVINIRNGYIQLKNRVNGLSIQKNKQNSKLPLVKTIGKPKGFSTFPVLSKSLSKDGTNNSSPKSVLPRKTVKYVKQLSTFRFVIKGHVNAMASVKGGWALIRIALSAIPVTGLQTTSARVRSIYCFLKILFKRYQDNGPKGACLQLKVYAVLLQQAIGGHVIPDVAELKFRSARTNRGLPRVIPVVHRNAIRAGDTATIRFYLTLFNLYRLIDFHGNYQMKNLTKTIVSAAKTTIGFSTLAGEIKAFIPLFWLKLGRLIRLNYRSLDRMLMEEYSLLRLSPLKKSSPFTMSPPDGIDNSPDAEEIMDTNPIISSHPLAIHESAKALDNSKELREPTLYFLGLLPNHHPVREIWSRCTRIPLPRQNATNQSLNPALGKLALKAESAGKVRVFAMVDCWTQWLLKPLHDLIFNQILLNVPQDGTFDQMKPIHGLLKSNPSYLASLDLSAATDRLPIWIQQDLLGFMTGKVFAQYWKEFLVNRDYSLKVPSSDYGRETYGDLFEFAKVRYAVGQPMGALSSWAMLALTHHFIVQFCAWRCNAVLDNQWFKNYAVLGDDIVIADPKVAKHYLQTMKILGVGIGLHKSLISKRGIALEFAKRTFYKGMDVSPVSFLEMQAAFSAPAAAVTFIRKYKLTIQDFLKAAGYRYRVLGGLQRHIGVLNSKVRLLILAVNTPTTVEEIEKFFSIGAKSSTGFALVETKEVIDLLVTKELVRIKRALNEMSYQQYSLEKTVLKAKHIAWQLFDRVGETGGIEFPYIFALVKEMMFQTMIHAKGTVLQSLDVIRGMTTKVMLSRYDMTPAQLLESVIALQKLMANLPLNSLNYTRVFDAETRTMTDTTYIRLWKSLSGILQGTNKTVKSVPFGLRDDPLFDEPSPQKREVIRDKAPHLK
jgi:hypothetical protein